ncbi:HAMP domain-containing sensor histidine kinase [Phytoactinopolyspora endophytica]|uniref:HAMP domain-containing sensor histidine kinase n=1 Tax=Phytoactinopolyspora endophytica TaxID=1642495 RepID=UPI00101D22F7|nr:HAMP domain-containing sensor histidine kinase [Phytoactinopolyspora endophytica]
MTDDGSGTSGERTPLRPTRQAGALWRSLRVRLAVLGFLAIYVPALLLFGVILATETDTNVVVDNGVETQSTSTERSPWVSWTVVALGPVAAGLAWWWSGRAVRPIDRVRAVAEDIEGTDLSRRIGLDHGPTEVVSLAASFDAMLDRLERAADTQRQLIEETSHELRIPLSVLSTNAEVLLAHPEPTVDVYRQGLERSGRAAARLQATIDDLLTDARGRARTIDRRPADVVAIVHGVVEDAGVLAATRQVDVSIVGSPSAVCPVDEATVARAVSNLVDNAIKHAPSGSTVEVTVEVTESEATVVVTDHGPGIPPDQQDHIFQRFWRGRHDTDGTGLGLPIASQIAQAHGGNLTVTSPGPAGDGCTLRLSLRR